jgi:hypothetical protein
VLANLKASFDRQAFVDKLLRQYHFLPEDFRLWILEWPEKAVVGGSWPGLPRKRYQGEYADGIHVRAGENWIAFPQISAIFLADGVNKMVESMPALLVWQDQKATWLILDERRNLSGKVKFTSRFVPCVQILQDFDMIEGADGWIAYQMGIWEKMVEMEHRCGGGWSKSGVPSDNSMTSFLQIYENSHIAWVRRHEVESQIS